jgi:hypothetical protein
VTPTPEQLAGLNVALNEARLLSFDLDLAGRVAIIGLSVLTLPKEGPAPDNARIELRLFPVGRVTAALVDSEGRVRSLGIERLSDAVRDFGGRPIYGWEFFDPPSTRLTAGSGRLSLDFRAEGTSLNHTLHLFQEDRQQKLDVCVSFDQLDVRDTSRDALSLDEVIAGGKRWWDGLYSGDPRTRTSGIHPLKK